MRSSQIEVDSHLLPSEQSSRDSAFSFRDLRVDLNHFCVEQKVLLRVVGKVVFVKNRFYGAFGDACFAVNAILWIDVEHIWALVKTVARAYRYACGIFAAHTLFRYNECHDLFSLK